MTLKEGLEVKTLQFDVISQLTEFIKRFGFDIIYKLDKDKKTIIELKDDLGLGDKILALTKECLSFTERELKDECSMLKFNQLKILVDTAEYLLKLEIQNNE
jgi:hypothetical protein